jgi:transposase
MLYTGGMRPIRVPPLTESQVQELDELYHTSESGRLRSRAQLVLLSTEQQMKVPQIASIVRESEETIRRWLKHYLAEGVNGLPDAPQPGRPATITADYRQKLLDAVRRRPRSLNLPYSLWTLQRLADYLAEQTGIRVSDETVRTLLHHNGIVLSRPQHKISSPDPEYAVKKRRLKKPATT